MPMPRPLSKEPVKDTVTVYAKNEQIQKFIRHPSAITQFDRNGKAVWPNDQFTTRRIRDGDVTTEAPGAAKKAAAPKTTGS